MRRCPPTCPRSSCRRSCRRGTRSGRLGAPGGPSLANRNRGGGGDSDASPLSVGRNAAARARRAAGRCRRRTVRIGFGIRNAPADLRAAAARPEADLLHGLHLRHPARRDRLHARSGGARAALLPVDPDRPRVFADRTDRRLLPRRMNSGGARGPGIGAGRPLRSRIRRDRTRLVRHLVRSAGLARRRRHRDSQHGRGGAGRRPRPRGHQLSRRGEHPVPVRLEVLDRKRRDVRLAADLRDLADREPHHAAPRGPARDDPLIDRDVAREQRQRARGGAQRAGRPDRGDPSPGQLDVRSAHGAAGRPPARSQILRHRADHGCRREALRRAPPPVQPVPPGARGGDGAGPVAERGDAQQATEALMRRLLRAALLCCAAASGGCATYSDQLLAAHNAALSGDWPGAEQQVNAMLGVDSRADLPEDFDSERSLAVLERAVVLQSQGAWSESARDLSAAERELELIDFEVDALGTIGNYVHRRRAAKPPAPPLELFAVSVLNMLNYLEMADLQGAAVEARRYQVMRDYLDNQGVDRPRGRIGAYLAGFVFERLGEADRALRYYQDVLEETKLRSLD